MKKLLLIVALIGGCGSGGGSSSNSSLATAISNDNEPATEKQKEEQKTEESVLIGARLIMPGEESPKCESDSHGLLIYIKDDASFYYCDENLGWVAIDLRGRDGRDGAIGAPGKDGRDGLNGRDGINGINGDDGSDGAAAPVVDAKQWIHPLDNRKWFLGRFLSAAGAAAMLNNGSVASDPYCPTGARLPTVAEALDAGRAGIFHKIVPSSEPFIVEVKDNGNNTITVTRIGTGVLQALSITESKTVISNGTGYSSNAWTNSTYILCVANE